MVANDPSGRPRGRPQTFDRDTALEQAMALFWAHGYDGVEMDRIAQAVGVTKPSLYRAFGDKPALFMKAMRRYADTYGAGALAAFTAEPDIAAAVAAFCEASVRAATSEDGRTGCLMACAVAGPADRPAEVRRFLADGLAAAADVLAERFAREMAAGRVAEAVPAQTRGRMLIDLMQGLALRARAGVSREVLLEQAKGYVAAVLR